MYLIFCVLLSWLAVVSHANEYDQITCGTVTKLRNTNADVRLHSHDVRYGSGSGQQSVTGVQGADDHNSYWQIRAKTGSQCNRGEPVACGDTIRLFHLTTKRNLHSHLFAAPLSNNAQEVSAFGENGFGDEGDHWMVVCQGSDKHWQRNKPVRLRHVQTGAYLQVSGERYQRPIAGQYEITATAASSDRAFWQAAEGIYVSANSMLRDGSRSVEHDPSEF